MSMSDFLSAVEHGAASIYHAVLETGVAIVNLSTTHPEVAALLSQGATVANDVLRRCGIPGLVLTVVEDDILTSIKLMASQDATVPTSRVSAAQSSGVLDHIADDLNAVVLAKIEESRV
jgi:hypothetical protein